MRGSRPLLMTALVTLFLAQGQRAFFGSLFGLGYEAVFPELRLGPALVAAAFLLALLAPLLPLARWLDRAGAVAISALAVAVFRLPMTHPALETRLAGGALVLAAAASFLTWAVGYLDRRSIAGGLVMGLVADQLLRLAGSSYDLSLRPSWLPVQAVLSLALIALTLVWARQAGREQASHGLERRAGGLRLRGALALGTLLFLELHVLGLPPVVARWAGVPYPWAGVAIALAGAAALAGTLLLRRPTGGRAATLSLAAVATAAALLGYRMDGPVVALAMAAGHLAVLLLLTRAVDPASGRRSGGAVAAGLLVFVAATALYGLTFYSAFTVPALDGRAPWIFGAAGLLLAGCFILLPRPAEMTRPSPWWPSALAVAGVALVGLGLVVVTARAGAGAGAGAGAAARAAAAEDGRVRVATWNIHFGFDEAWRFDPEAMARTLVRADADVVALQEVIAGAPTAYGVDFPLWLARRTRLRQYFSPTINGLLGEAFLTRLDAVRVGAHELPAGGGDRKQVLRLIVEVGGESVSFNALHLGVRGRARPPQIAAALATLGPGPAVVLGDLNAEAGSPVTARLARAGFLDVFHDDDGPRPATFPARSPSLAIDWIWLRGLRVDSAAVLTDDPSDHRAVVATLHILPRRIRSTEDNDLQTP